MSLYHKYRPTKLEDIVGNTAVIASISALFIGSRREAYPSAYLLTGPSGTGKTTTARILAGKLGCDPADVQEIDSADFRGIDTIRDIRQKMRLKPLNGPVRAYILDEVAQLSRDAMSALLKALEDPPAHVYFMLATTDPQKLLPTIRNRCLTFEMQPLPSNRMEYLLKKVCRQEGKEATTAAISKIITNAHGSARAALVMLDSVIDLAPELMEASVGLSGEMEKNVIGLCRVLMAKSTWTQVRAVLKALEEVEPEKVRQAVLGYCANTLLNGDNPKAYLVLDSFKEPFYSAGKAQLVRACYEATNQ